MAGSRAPLGRRAVPVTHLWSQPGPPFRTSVDRVPDDVSTFCGLPIRVGGVWLSFRVGDEWFEGAVPAFTVELVYHAPRLAEDRPYCDVCLRYLARNPFRCVCGGAGGYSCDGVANGGTSVARVSSDGGVDDEAHP